MVQDDSSAAATKQDIAIIQEQLNVLLGYIGTLASKESVDALKEDLKQFVTKEDMRFALKESEEHILVALEHARYDMIGIHKDTITEHEQRISKLELITGSRG